MDKPLSMVMKELTQKLVKDINESGLPPVILAYIVKDVNSLVQDAAMKQIANDESDYMHVLEESKEKEA